MIRMQITNGMAAPMAVLYSATAVIQRTAAPKLTTPIHAHVFEVSSSI